MRKQAELACNISFLGQNFQKLLAPLVQDVNQ